MSKKLGMKFDNDKIQWHLLPEEPIIEIVKVLMLGAAKYAPENWKYVNDFYNRYYDALCRHRSDIKKFMEFKDTKYIYDDDTGLHHLAHLLCDGIFLLWKEIQGGNIDNETWKIKLQEIKDKYKDDRKKFKDK